MDDTGLEPAAATAVNQCLRLSPDETCLIVTDDDRLAIAEALYGAAAETGATVTQLRYEPGAEHGAEPPVPTGTAMAAVDAFLAPTSKSISHTRARQAACEAGARGATLPGITEDVFVTGLAADYDSIRSACERLETRLDGVSSVRVTTPAGTDVTFDVGTREWRSDTGLIHEPGAFSNLPAGEVFISPAAATGTYVVDGTMRPYGLLDPGQRITITVEDGYATDIDDDRVRESFERAAESVGRDAYNVAELGIGTNLGVTDLSGSVLLDEKAAGTVHIALGDDASIGGDTDAPIHADGVLRSPTVYVDGAELQLPGSTT